jgi:hypothetical protein
MASGTVEYAASIAGVRFEPIDLQGSHPAVDKVVLKTGDDRLLRITFHLRDVFDETEADTIATGILPSIINRIAFYRDVPVGEPFQTGFSIPKDASEKSFSVMSAIRIKDSARPLLTLGDDTRGEIKRKLEQPYTHHDLYSAYRFAGYQDDPVARFMFLYNILLQLNSDLQREVDDFIRSQEPNVAQSASPEFTGVMETVYARLRNEVGHIRAGSTPERTQAEIRANLPAFQKLVKTAISNAV